MIELHHPDQLWWPDAGLRKRDAVEYYREIAWEELDGLDPLDLTLRTVPERLGRLGDLLTEAPRRQRLRFRSVALRR